MKNIIIVVDDASSVQIAFLCLLSLRIFKGCYNVEVISAKSGAEALVRYQEALAKLDSPDTPGEVDSDSNQSTPAGSCPASPALNSMPAAAAAAASLPEIKSLVLPAAAASAPAPAAVAAAAGAAPSYNAAALPAPTLKLLPAPLMPRLPIDDVEQHSDYDSEDEPSSGRTSGAAAALRAEFENKEHMESDRSAMRIVILMDINMDAKIHLDGVVASNAIRTYQEKHNIPRNTTGIYCISDDDHEYRNLHKMGAANPMDGYLGKPMVFVNNIAPVEAIFPLHFHHQKKQRQAGAWAEASLALGLFKAHPDASPEKKEELKKTFAEARTQIKSFMS